MDTAVNMDLAAQKAISLGLALEASRPKSFIEDITVNSYVSSVRAMKQKTWPPHRNTGTTKRVSTTPKRLKRRLKRKVDDAIAAHKYQAAMVLYGQRQRQFEQFLRSNGITWRMVEKAAHAKDKPTIQVATELVEAILKQVQ